MISKKCIKYYMKKLIKRLFLGCIGIGAFVGVVKFIEFVHNHIHQQIAYVEQGVYEVEIDGRKEILFQGDCFVIPSNVMHGVKCLEAGTLIDTFSPKRDDFLT